MHFLLAVRRSGDTTGECPRGYSTTYHMNIMRLKNTLLLQETEIGSQRGLRRLPLPPPPALRIAFLYLLLPPALAAFAAWHTAQLTPSRL